MAPLSRRPEAHLHFSGGSRKRSQCASKSPCFCSTPPHRFPSDGAQAACPPHLCPTSSPSQPPSPHHTSQRSMGPVPAHPITQSPPLARDSPIASTPRPTEALPPYPMMRCACQHTPLDMPFSLPEFLLLLAPCRAPAVRACRPCCQTCNGPRRFFSLQALNFPSSYLVSLEQCPPLLNCWASPKLLTEVCCKAEESDSREQAHEQQRVWWAARHIQPGPAS